jgi:hypothetical protein
MVVRLAEQWQYVNCILLLPPNPMSETWGLKFPNLLKAEIYKKIISVIHYLFRSILGTPKV